MATIRLAIAVLSIAVSVLIPGAARAQSPIDISPVDAVGARARALNALGAAAGTAVDFFGQAQGFLWSAGIVAPISELSDVWAIGSDGRLVGSAFDPFGDQRAVLREADGVVTELGTLGGASSAAYGLSDDGRVVGAAQLDTGDWHAFVRTPEGLLTDLGTLGGAASAARALDGAGAVIGWAEDGTGTRRATRWQEGLAQDLLGGAAPTGSAAWAASGAVIVGEYFDDIGDTRAFAYRPAISSFVDLGSLGGVETIALGVADDAIVGTSRDALGERRAFLFLEALGGMVDLNQITTASEEGWFLETADAVAAAPDGWWIVGSGIRDASPRAYRLFLSTTAAPEPTSLLLLAPVLPLLRRTHQRRRRTHSDTKGHRE